MIERSGCFKKRNGEKFGKVFIRERRKSDITLWIGRKGVCARGQYGKVTGGRTISIARRNRGRNKSCKSPKRQTEPKRSKRHFSFFAPLVLIILIIKSVYDKKA